MNEVTHSMSSKTAMYTTSMDGGFTV